MEMLMVKKWVIRIFSVEKARIQYVDIILICCFAFLDHGF